MKRENAWKTYSAEQLAELEALAVRYKSFLDAGKTEDFIIKACEYYRKYLIRQRGREER